MDYFTLLMEDAKMLLTGATTLDASSKFSGNLFQIIGKFLGGIIHNEVFLFTVLAWATAQFLKIVITLFTERKLKIERLFGDGGMPSGHSATVTALAILVGWVEGFNTAPFALAAIFAVVTMHDAMGVRREAGKHAVSIKELAATVNEMAKDQDMEVKIEKLKILVGHTPLQVCAGAVLGFLVAVGGILLNIDSKWFAYPENWINLIKMK